MSLPVRSRELRQDVGAAAWAWSRWRRSHQHRAKISHYQRKLAEYNEVRLESLGSTTNRTAQEMPAVARAPEMHRAVPAITSRTNPISSSVPPF
jgi:hypothetical protein